MFKLIVPVLIIFTVFFANCYAKEIHENEIDFHEDETDFDDEDSRTMHKEFFRILFENLEDFDDYFSEEEEDSSLEVLRRTKRANDIEFSSLPHLLTSEPNSDQEQVNNAHAPYLVPEVSTVANEMVNKNAEVDEDIVNKQAANAKYDFANVVDDNINGNFMFREEKRNGYEVKGQFSYDDGHIMRTVSYVADKDGFRIIKDEIVPSIKSVTNLNGMAAVASFSNGENMNYQISRSDIHQVKSPRRKDVIIRQK